MSEIIDRIVQFKNSTTTKSLRQYYATNSLMEIYSINRKEIRHTSFFKWLFDKDTEIAKSALKKILDVIITKSDLNTFSNELQQLIILGNYEIDYWNSIENLSVNNGFVDLYIELKIANFNVEIIIENKIYSNEHNDQTQRYYDHFSKENKNTEKIFLYLTPISTLELEKLVEAECCCKNYIQINYQTIVDQIIEPIIEEGVNKNIEFILQDYLKALSSPVSTKENNNKYMAISNKENELLSRFWEENEDLILKAVEATKDNTHIEPERRDTASKISELLNNKSEKIGAYAKRNIVSLFKQNKINQEEIINFQDAEYSKKILDIQYPLLKKVINRNDKPLHYWKDTVFANNDEYHLCCEWFENENNNDRVYFDKWLKTK